MEASEKERRELVVFTPRHTNIFTLKLENIICSFSAYFFKLFFLCINLKPKPHLTALRLPTLIDLFWSCLQEAESVS